MSLSQDEDDEEDLVIEPAATKVNATNNNEAKIQGLLARLEFLRVDNLNKDEQYKIEKRLFELIRHESTDDDDAKINVLVRRLEFLNSTHYNEDERKKIEKQLVELGVTLEYED